MSKKIGFVLMAVLLLSGCEGYMEKKRQIEAQQQATQIQLATIQAEKEKAIAAKQAEEQRKASEHRTDQVIGLVGFIFFLATPVGLVYLFLAYRARVTQLHLHAAVALAHDLSEPQREAVVAGLLAQSSISSKTLRMLAHQRR